MQTSLTYDVVGEGEALVFMHGLGADRRQTTSALSHLAGVKLIAPDFRAHGESLYKGDVLSFNQFADDIIAVLDELGIEKANVGGLSMGSAVTLNLAIRYPERVNKIIILRPSWLDKKQPDHLKLVADAGVMIDEHGVVGGELELEKSDAYLELLAENEKVAQSINGVFKRPQALDAAPVLYEMWKDCPLSSVSQLEKISNEALVLYTTRDELHPVSIAKSIFEGLPNSKLVELPPRYYQNAEYTESLREAVADFLAESR